MESFHDLSWHVMIYHDKRHVLSWNVTKYHYTVFPGLVPLRVLPSRCHQLSSNVFQVNIVTFDDMSWCSQLDSERLEADPLNLCVHIHNCRRKGIVLWKCLWKGQNVHNIQLTCVSIETEVHILVWNLTIFQVEGSGVEVPGTVHCWMLHSASSIKQWLKNKRKTYPLTKG